jgi:hypothetical protein
VSLEELFSAAKFLLSNVVSFETPVDIRSKFVLSGGRAALFSTFFDLTRHQEAHKIQICSPGLSS